MNERIRIIRKAEAGWVAYLELLAGLPTEDLERPNDDLVALRMASR